MTSEEMSGATFSPLPKYRYLLWRRWAKEPNGLLCVLLNPSTANEFENDPTVTRCLNRAVRMGFTSLEVVNLFAFRATDPAEMMAQQDPIGPDNDEVIRRAVQRAVMVLCGWGSLGKYLDRDAAVLKILDEEGRYAHVLGLNTNDTPMHPLYISYNVYPQIWKR